jgi:hypothetical protein
VDLLRSPNQNVQQAAAGALRNLVFRSTPNKLETRRQNGIREAVNLLRRTGSTEIQKQLTGRALYLRLLAVASSWCTGQSLQAGPISRESNGSGIGQISGVWTTHPWKVMVFLRLESKGRKTSIQAGSWDLQVMRREQS